MQVPKRLLKLIKEGNEIKFYKSKEWLSVRAEVLKRDNKECQHCKAKGKMSPAECVHHIKHLKDYPELGLDENNLTSLCNTCHNIEHPEKLKKNEKRFINEERWE